MIALDIGLRLAVALMCLATASYALIAYIPFTYTEAIRFNVFSGLGTFARWHPLVAWLVVLAAALAMREALARRIGSAVGLTVVLATAAAYVTWRPLLPSLESDTRSLAVALVALAPVGWLGWVDWHTRMFALTWEPADLDGDAGRLALAAAVTAPIVWLLPVVAGRSELGDNLLLGVPAAILVSAGACAVALFWQALAAGRSRAEFVLGLPLLTLAFGLAVERVVFAAVGFTGSTALATACGFGAALASCWGSIALVAGTPGSGRRTIGSGLALWLAPSGVRPSALATTIRLAAVMAAVWLVSRTVAAVDWDFLGQKLAAIAGWTLIFTSVFAALPRRRLAPGMAVIAATSLGPVAFAAAERWAPPASAERLAAGNATFRLVRDGLATARGGAADTAFYEFLRAHTNIGPDVPIAPIDVEPAGPLTAPAATRPPIFIVVIDSLRRDYLSPFNQAVTFTPSIDRFARESIAFRNAYTRYGATGLSEPSIWTGGMLPHRQYVMPFAPLNALATLVETNRYRELVSVDTILSAILQPTPRRSDLDAGVATRDYDLCRSLDTLTARLATDRSPVFVYTQPLNLHVSVLARQGNRPVDEGRYDGFDAAYASRVKRLDGCFGAFIDRLKASGLYDQSVIVLTSDHGDSLGEEGRRGHAYTIFPEIMRIPLILHLPREAAGGYTADPDALVFSTDITPTLYELLGYTPTETAFPFGRPLVHRRGAPPPAPRADDELVASSYGAVYGVLRGGGRRFYIADAVNYQDYLYDMTVEPIGRRIAVAAGERDTARDSIRRRIEEISRVYRLPNLER